MRYLFVPTMLILGGSASFSGESAKAAPKLTANTWVRVAEDGGKRFSNIVGAEQAGKLYTWGPGSFEVQSFDPTQGRWIDALPSSKVEAWGGGKGPIFLRLGQGGTKESLRYVPFDAGSAVTVHNIEGLSIPSPCNVFNQSCYDSSRHRILFYVGGKTLALKPVDNTWTDLKPKESPTACETLTWASMCYDPVNDEAMLFGGGMAFNLDGGSRTWLYDCKANTWRRLDAKVEPPLRCNSPLVFDKKSKSIVMFGGDTLAAATNETWVYRCAERTWEERMPNPSPPPMFLPATAAVPGGGVLVFGVSAANQERKPQAETWIYDVGANSWRSPEVADAPVGLAAQPLNRNDPWVTAAGLESADAVYLYCDRNGKSETFAFRYNPAGPASKAKGASPGTVVYKIADQKAKLEAAPPPDHEAHEKFLKELPTNHWVDANPPATVINKTWGSATFDTDRGEVLYTGGGHSGYSGNDVAHYNVGDNRWSLSWPPHVAPYCWGASGSIFGWSYGARPWTQHSYRWYCYDSVSKMMVYCPRNSPDGREVLIDSNPTKAFRLDQQKGFMTVVYDPVRRSYFPPDLSRPFRNTWDLCLTTTPHGIYATTAGKMYHAKVQDGGKVQWKLVDENVPKFKAGYHYEWVPTVYDSKRNRLLLFTGKADLVETYERPLGEGGTWKQLETKGATTFGRETAYSPQHDAVLFLGSKGRLFVLDCSSHQWRELDTPSAYIEGTVDVNTAMVYDPKRDLCVLLVSSNNVAPNKVFLLRYDPATAKYK